MAETPKWWSKSANKWKALADMHDRELLNAYRKLERGEYREPDGECPSVEADLNLRNAFDVEFAHRNMDPAEPSGYRPQEEGA